MSDTESAKSENITKPPIVVSETISGDTQPDGAPEKETAYIDGLFKRENLKTLQQNNEERKKYARHIFLFTVVWAVAIISIVLFCGWEYKSFKLSDTVLVTLITTTTVNFFGFFLLVVKYLFNPDKST